MSDLAQLVFNPPSAKLKITVENLATASGGTFLTPVWVGVHDGSFDLYDRDAPNFREGLERIAEDGTTDTIDQEFMTEQPLGSAGVVLGGLGVPGPIDPIESASLYLDVGETDTNRFFAFASMVIPSNDAFLSSPGDPLAIELFDETGAFNGPFETILTGNNVLDAGTEVNTEEDAAFLNQTAPDTGIDENGNVVVHPGFNGSIGNPDATPVNVLGGTTAPGAVIDPFFGDFARADGETPLLRVTVEEVPTGVDALLNLFPVDFANLEEVAPGTLPGDGGGEATVTFLSAESGNDNVLGYYVYDLETGVIGEGFITTASSDAAHPGASTDIAVHEGQGIAPFLIPDGASLGIDFSAFAEGGITFEAAGGGHATIFDDAPPVVLANGEPTGLTPLHGLDGNPGDGMNPLNPEGLVHATSVTVKDDLSIIAFEDLIGGGDGDTNDAILALSDGPLSDDDVATLRAILEPDGFVNQVDDAPFADLGADPLSFADLLDLGANGGLYVNVHSTDFAGGEVRGQLAEVDDGDPSLLTLEAMLTPDAEVVPPGGLDPAGISDAMGTARITVDTLTQLYDAEISVNGISPSELAPVGGPAINSPVHIHIGGPDVNGPIAVNTGAPGGDGSIQPLLTTDDTAMMA